MMKRLTAGLADSQDQVEPIVERLIAAGFSPDEVSALLKGSTRRFAHDERARWQGSATVMSGGLLGAAVGLAAGLGSPALLHFGPVLAACFGATAGALGGWGVAKREARRRRGTGEGAGNLKLHYWNWSWPLVPCLCPCDLDFVNYLRTRQISKRAIFHFGSGAHHLLGKANLEAGAPNQIFAVTASPEEHKRYVDFLIANPAAACNYKVLFTDVYTLSEELLPVFDLVTLFHLHEFYDEKKQRYAHLNDQSLLDLFLRRLSDGGLVFFYKGSNGFARTANMLKAYSATRRLVFQEEYRSLVIYRRGPTNQSDEGDER